MYRLNTNHNKSNSGFPEESKQIIVDADEAFHNLFRTEGLIKFKHKQHLSEESCFQLVWYLDAVFGC